MNHSPLKILENNKGKILVVAQCDRAYYPHKLGNLHLVLLFDLHINCKHLPFHPEPQREMSIHTLLASPNESPHFFSCHNVIRICVISSRTPIEFLL